MITCVRAPLRLRQVTRATPATRMYAVFVPLRHDPGHAQVDFGEALAVIGGVERKIHFFAKDLPHSDGCLLQDLSVGEQRSFL